jgi:hypothetical protein
MDVCQDIQSSNINNFVSWNHFFIELDNHKKIHKIKWVKSIFFKRKKYSSIVNVFSKNK